MTGKTTAWVRHDGYWQASDHRKLMDGQDPDIPGGEIDAGAKLPISYDMSALPATKWYVAPTTASPPGNNSNAGTLAAPFATLNKAVTEANNAGTTGQAIIVRGGIYQMTGTAISITVRGLLITAYDNETPIFEGSIKLLTTPDTSEPGLVKFPYVQMPSRPDGDGINLSISGAYPVATFNGSTPTGLALERGFAKVTGATSYEIPSPQVKGTGTYKVIVGMYSDQCWKNNEPLKQVIHKSLVKPGFFFVDRANANDGTVGRSTHIYLHPTDAAEVDAIRVSSNGGNTGSTGNFIFVDADNVTIRGLKIVRHSPSLAFFTIQTEKGIDGLKLENVYIEEVAGVAIKLFGGHDDKSFNKSELITNTILSRVTVDGASWQGMSAMYTNDTKVTRCKFTKTNPWVEFEASPKSGAIKAGKNHRLVVEHSHFSDMGGHGIWLDQSDYDCTVASNFFENSTGSLVFWEISHRLLLINNLMVRSSDSGITLRISGASGVWAINNTIVGGVTTYYCICDDRSRFYTGSRPLAEHAERYGAGNYGGDAGGGHPYGDLDSSRPGEYHPTLPSETVGLDWMGGSEAVVNNIIAHYATGTGAEVMAMYFRPTAKSETYTINPQLALPLTAALFDGNIYQIAGSRMAQVSTKLAGGTTVQSNLSGWRTGLKASALYGPSASPEEKGREGKGPNGAGWVTRLGKPTTDLAVVQGTAALVTTTDTEMLDRIKSYIDIDQRQYGSNVSPPGGW